MDGGDYIVVDAEDPKSVGNRILDPDYAALSPGGTVVSCLAQFARERGWSVTTAGVFLAERPSFRQAVSLSEEFTSYLPMLVQIGVKPGLLFSGEGPNYAVKFYRDLPSGSAPFSHACLFRGCLSRLARGVEVHPYLWPCPDLVEKTECRWSERRLLGVVAGLKGVWSGPRAWLRRLPETLQWYWYQLREPSLRLRDLYGRRFKLIRQFAPEPNFVLRGTGWEITMAGNCRWYRKSIQFANPPTPCRYGEKLSVLGGCRFALTMESAIYPGFVTEKIFDAFRAGTVPIYLGAPDITDFVPPECFIDCRRFAAPERLWDYLNGLPESQWTHYREAARAFLASTQYQRHSDTCVARRWLEWLEDAANQKHVSPFRPS